MRVAIVGATGKTGNELLDQALTAGHTVVAYVRRPEAVTRAPGVTVIKGQLDDIDTMTAAFDGCDAVIVTLGTSVRNRNKPLHSFALPTIIEAARQAGINRIIQLSALGVGVTLGNTRYPYRLGAMTLLKGNFTEHHLGESQLLDSDSNWTTIHPGPLFDGPRTAHPTVVDAATGTKMSGSPRTMRADVAATILNVLDDPSTYGKQILVTSTPQRA